MVYVVLDRDGTLIRHIPYLHDPLHVEVLPTVVDGLTVLVNAGCKLFLHTNQSGVGRGYFPLSDVIACNDMMLRHIGMGEGLFEDICIAPERPNQKADRRKPSPNFGLSIIAKYAAVKESLCYIGDNITDLLTAQNLGCLGIGVNTGLHDLRGQLESRGMKKCFPVFDSFLEAADYVVRYNRN